MRRVMLRLVAGLCLLGACILAPAGARATTLFGLLDTGELYSSTNGGATWTPKAALPVNDAVGLYASSSTLKLFLATRSGTIYRSLDGGTTWSAVGAVAASDVGGRAEERRGRQVGRSMWGSG